MLGAPEVPVPFAATLESAWLPSRDRITGHVLTLLGPGSGDGAAPDPAGSAGSAGAAALEPAGGAAPKPIGGGRAQQPA